MSKYIEFAAMVPKHIHRQRQVREHVGKNDRDRAQRARKAKIIQRSNSSEQAEPKHQRNRDHEKYPHGAMGCLMPGMDLAQKLRQQSFAPGIKQDARL